MKGVFSIDGPVMSFLNKVADLVWLNILYIICCIPIVTIGASTTALYYVTMKMISNEEGYITRNFFKSFKQNFKQATIIWAIILVVCIVLFFDFRILQLIAFPGKKIFSVVMTAIGMILMLTMIYIFPLLAKFENTVKNMFKNALILSMAQFPRTLCIVFIMCLPIALYLVAFYIAIPFALLIGFSGVAYSVSFFFVKIFEKYFGVKPEEEEQTRE